MKNKMQTTILIIIALASVALANSQWVGLNGTEGFKAEPCLKVIESNLSGTTISIKIPGLMVDDIENQGLVYKRINLPSSVNASQTFEAGKPMLPVIFAEIAVPPTSGVKVSVEVKSEVVLKDYLVYPVQPVTPISEEPANTLPLEIDSKFYSTNTVYPAKVSNLSGPQISRDIRYVDLRISPVRYNPLTKELRVAKEITIHLDYSGTDMRNVPVARTKPRLEEIDKYNRARFLNYDELYGQLGVTGYSEASPIRPGYLIIYAPSSVDQDYLGYFAIEQLLFGRDVKLVNVNTIGNNRASIDQYINDWHNSPPLNVEPLYVLLVGDGPTTFSGTGVETGDASHMATGWVEALYYVDEEHYDPNCSSDFEYGNVTHNILQGWDYEADLAIGRWPSNSSDYFITLYTKWLANQSCSNEDWNPDKYLMVASHADVYDFYAWKKSIVDNYLSGYEVDSAYGDYLYVTNQTVKDIINNNGGVGIVNYAGHGDTDKWLSWGWWFGENFANEDVYTLTNSFENPVVFNIACKNGIFTGTEKSLCEAWLDASSFAYGASGTLGASQEVPGVPAAKMDQVIFANLFQAGQNCGMAVKGAKDMIIHEYSGSDNEDMFSNAWEQAVDAMRMFQWFGDPAMDIWTAEPVDAYIEATSTIILDPAMGGVSLLVHVLRSSDNAPIPGVKVSMYKGSMPPTGSYEYHQVGYTGTDGIVCFNIDYTNFTPGSAYIMASGYRGASAILPAQAAVNFVAASPVSGVDDGVQTLTYNLEALDLLGSTARISYSVAGKLGSSAASFVKISVYDASGREVKILASGNQNPGQYMVTWDGCDASGAKCGTGVYFVRMQADDFQSAKKITLIK